jgi:TolB-like protein/class 3 adenylate cyclase
MSLAREQRKLAAIVAADVVGYSRLMGRDESGTLARLRKSRSEHLDPVLKKYGGRLVKLTGDGALIEFTSAVDALSAAIEFQQAMAEANADRPAETALVFRMGLHLGDLIVDGDDLYGDGVNIAARLEAEAPPGGIVISRAVHEAVTGRLMATFDDLGSLALKNIERPIQAFRVRWESLDWKALVTPEVTVFLPVPLPLPDKPSIAVLPFANMSDDPEQEYFADGIVEDIITALSRFKSLFVIARNSSFTYKGKAIDIKQVGRELGVRYVLEGSIRRAGGRVRITGQLINSQTGMHVWADRFDGPAEDVFDLQDRVTASVTGQLPLHIEQSEIERTKTKPTTSLGAYESHLYGMKALYQSTRASVAQSLRHFYHAIEQDPEFVLPHAWATVAYVLRKQNVWMDDISRETEEAVRLGRRAVELGPDDHRALGCAGFALAYIAGDIAAGIFFLDQAIELNPNDAIVWHGSGWVRCYNGDHDLAIEHIERAERLSPRDPYMDQLLLAKSLARFCTGHYEETIALCKRVLQRHPNHLAALVGLARSSAIVGKHQEALAATRRALQVNPNLRSSHMSAASIMRREADRDLLRRSELLAGVPE